MATVGLASLFESQEQTNKELEVLNDRFLEFFRQSARDRMDLMEMLREMKGGGDGGGDGGGTPSAPTEDTGGGGGLFGGMGLASMIGATIAAIALNSLGAYWSKNFGETLKGMGTKIADFAKSTGEKVNNTFSKAKESLGKKLDDLGKKMGEMGKKLSDAAKGAKNFVADKAGKVGAKVSGAAGKVKDFFAGAPKAGQEITTAKGNAVVTTGAKVAEGRVQVMDPNNPGRVYTISQEAFEAAGGKGNALQRAGQAAKGVGKAVMDSKIVRGAGKLLAPLAIGTSAYEGITKSAAGTNAAQDKLAMQDPTAAGAVRGAAGVGYFGSAMVGGLADFAKLITVDAIIEAGQKLGAIPEEGYFQRVQETSVQKDVFDPLVDKARTAIAESLIEETAAANVAGGAPVVIQTNNNVNAPTTTSVTTGGGTAMPSAVSSNGTRPDAYAP